MRLASTVATLLISLNKPFECIRPTLVRPPIILFSGTQNLQDLFIDDLNIRPIFWPKGSNEGGFVHGGFALRTERLIEEMDEFINTYDNYVLGGHSLGGTCAILSASHLQKLNKTVENVFVFGTPNLATNKFKKFYQKQELFDRTISFVTPKDPVVMKIPKLYRSVGEKKILLYDSDNIWAHHDMATYNRLI